MEKVIILNDNETIIRPGLCTCNHKAWYGINATNFRTMKVEVISDNELAKLIDSADKVEDFSNMKHDEEDCNTCISAEMLNVILVIHNGPFEVRIQRTPNSPTPTPAGKPGKGNER